MKLIWLFILNTIKYIKIVEYRAAISIYYYRRMAFRVLLKTFNTK